MEEIQPEPPKKPSRPEKAPHKSIDPEGWRQWWTETIREMMNEGKTLSQIQEELGVNPKRFID